MDKRFKAALWGVLAAGLLVFTVASVVLQGGTGNFASVDATSLAERVSIYGGSSTNVATVDGTSNALRFTPYDTTGRSVALSSKPTYAASSTFTPAATPTDIVKITGSASKTIRVISLKLTTTNTGAGSQQFSVIVRSADDTTGTFVAATAVPMDSTDPAATATVGHYTANPGGLGAAVGTINTLRVASPVAVPGSFAGVVMDAGFEMLPYQQGTHLPRPVVLRGAAQVLVVNFAGAALVAGQTHAYTIVWTEE